MYKKFILVAVGFFFFSCFNLAEAEIVINEIMYNLDGADIDFVEILNNGDDIDLSNLKLLISNSESNHSIENYSGSSILGSGEIGVIVVKSVVSNYINKWDDSGNIFISSFSLPNEIVSRVDINNGDKTSPLDFVTYDPSQGASEDGDSLQLVNGSWRASSPTPGSQNSGSSSEDNSGEEDDDSNYSSGDEEVAEIKITTTQKSKAQITAKSLAYTGIPFALEGKAFGADGEQAHGGKYFWNFGDGDFREVRTVNVDRFEHTYFYPGEYTILFEYYPNFFAYIPDASAKLTIKVVTPEISISSVGGAGDFFVELANNTNYAVDLSNWLLVSNRKSFTIPRGTMLSAKDKMTISSQITNFVLYDKDTLRLINSGGEVAFDFSASAYLAKKNISQTIQTTNPATVNAKTISEDDYSIGPEEISASLASSRIFEEEEEKIPSFIPIISFLFIGASAGAVYFIRKKKTVVEPGGDFGILDE